MNKQLTKYFNRTQTWNFNFINDIYNDLFFEEIKKDIQTDIDKNLFKRPNTTCNWLISTYKQIEQGQNYIHKRYIVDITNRIINKDTNITPEESMNFENAGYVLTDLDEIKDIILDAIKTVKPELIKAKKQTPDNAASNKNKKEKENIPKVILEFTTDLKNIVYEGIKPYIDKEEYHSLFELLSENDIESKITFKGPAICLIELFKRIEYNNKFKVSPQKNTIANWIINNFTTNKGNIKYNYAIELLTKSNVKLNKDKRLCFPEFPILTEEKLKGKKQDN